MMPATMAECVIKHAAFAKIAQIEDWHCGFIPVEIDKACGFARKIGLHQDVDRCHCLAQIQLINHIEIIQPLGQRMIAINNFDMERRADGGVGLKLRAENLHHVGAFIRAIHPSISEPQDRIRAVKREPAPARFNERADGGCLLGGWHQIASISDQEFAGGDPLNIAIIRRDSRADMGMFRKQLEQLKPRKINVVIFAGGDKMGINPLCHDRKFPPPSTVMSAPVVKLASAEARNNIALATSSASPTRPIGWLAANIASPSSAVPGKAAI